MAIRYVKSGASGTADGTSWTNAFTTLASAATGSVAGDTLYVSHTHAEGNVATVTMAFPGTPNSPVHIICVNDTTGAIANTALMTTNGSFGLNINGSIYVYGVTFRVGVASTGSTLFGVNQTDGHKQVYESCNLEMASIGSSASFYFGVSSTAGTETSCVLINTNLKLGAAAQALRFRSSKFRWQGGSISAGSAVLNDFIDASCQQLVDAEFHGVDLSNLGASTNLVETGFTVCGHVLFANCKLPPSWSGELVGGAVAHPGFRAEMHNCDSADTNYRFKATDFAGSISTETTRVMSGGDWGTDTPYSLKMDVTNLNTVPYFSPLDSPAIHGWNSKVGTPVTVTVEILHDSLTNLKNDEVWVEVQYLGTSGFPLGVFISDAKANFLAAGADQDVSSAVWNTSGMTNPKKQKLVVTFTPQEAGYIKAIVYAAKPGIVYVAPMQVS